MMIYFFRKIKVALDFDNNTFVRCDRAPAGAVPVDLVAVDPDCTQTRLRHLTVNCKPCAVLSLSAWDAASFVTMVNAVEGLSRRRFYRLFHGNPDAGLRSVVRTAFDLSAPGECGYYKALQHGSRPADWQALRASGVR